MLYNLNFNIMTISEIDKKLKDKILPDFASVQNPIGLLGPLSDLQRLLSNTQSINWILIKEKNLLSKRLSQCLNILNSNDGIHQHIINFYDSLFDNFLKHNHYIGEDLGLYLPGVFSFFQNANYQRKLFIINNFLTNRFLELDKEEIYISLPGFINGIIPGFEEINEQLVKSVQDLFIKVIKKVGENKFFNSLYSCILKSSNIRLAGIKLMTNFIPIFSYEKEAKICIKKRKKNYITENNNTKKEVISNNIVNSENAEQIDKSINERSNSILKRAAIDNTYVIMYNNSVFDKLDNKEDNIIEESKLSEEIKINLKAIYINKYFSDIEILFANTINALLEDENIMVTKMTIDFLIKKLPFNSIILTESTRVKFLTNLLYLFKTPNNNITRRFLQWTLGNLHEEDDIDNTNKDIVILISCLNKSLKNIIYDKVDRCDDVYSMLKILEIFFKLKELFIHSLFSEISFILIKAVNKLFSEVHDSDLLIRLRKFLQSDEIYPIMLWDSLKTNFIDIMEKVNLNFDNNKLKLNNSSVLLDINKIDSNSFKDNNSEYYAKEIINYAYILSFARSLLPPQNVETNFIIVDNLVKSVFIVFDIYSLEHIIYVLNISLDFLIDFKNNILNKRLFKDKDFGYESTINNVDNIIYNNTLKDFNIKSNDVCLENNLSEEKYKPLFEDSKKFFCIFYISVVKFIWNNQNIYNKERELFKKSTEFIITLENINETCSSNLNSNDYMHHDIQNNNTDSITVPIWSRKLFMLIYSKNITLSIDAIQFITTILQYTTTSKTLKLIQKFYYDEIIDIKKYEDSIINSSYNSYFDNNTCDSNLDLEKINNNNNNNNNVCVDNENILRGTCIELLFDRLWKLLDYNVEQVRVSQLTHKLFFLKPECFANNVLKSFSCLELIGKEEQNQSKASSLEKTVVSIKRFKQFWKLSMEFFSDTLYFNNYSKCLFNMLECLNHEHPVLRHYSKSWIVHTAPQLYKILNPILAVLYSVTNLIDIQTNKAELLIYTEYPFKEVLGAFDKLKQVIMNMKYQAINYFLNKPVSKCIIEADKLLNTNYNSINNTEIDSENIDNCKKYLFLSKKDYTEWMYFEYIVSITLRFIKVQLVMRDEHSNDFKIKDLNADHFSVNSAACEFLEFLITFIDEKSRIVDSSYVITDTILEILHKNIIDKDEVIQIQLLNLLTVIYQINICYWKSNKVESNKVFNSHLLHQCINKGLQTEYTYLRSHYIEFAEMLLPLFETLIDHDSNNAIATKLLISNSDYLTKSIISNSNQKDKRLKKLNNSKSIISSTVDNKLSSSNITENCYTINENVIYPVKNHNIELSFVYGNNNKSSCKDKLEGNIDVQNLFKRVSNYKNDLTSKKLLDSLDNINFSDDNNNTNNMLTNNIIEENNIVKDSCTINSNDKELEIIKSIKNFIFKSNKKTRGEEDYENKMDDLDTAMIIKGIKKVLFHYIGIIKPVNILQVLDWELLKKNLLDFEGIFDKENRSIFSFVKDVISNKNNSYLKNNVVASQVFEDILASLIFAWKNDGILHNNYDYYLNSKGILSFNKEDILSLAYSEEGNYYNNKNFHFDSQEDINTSNNNIESKFYMLQNKINSNPLKHEIIHIARNLFISSPLEFFDKFINLWIKEEHRYFNNYFDNSNCNNKNSFVTNSANINNNYLLYTLIEILISLNIPDDIVFLLIRKGLVRQQIKSKNKLNGYYPFVYTINGCIYEQKICQLIYSYILYVSSIKTLKIESLDEILKILEFFNESKYPITKVWIFEIINIVGELFNSIYILYSKLINDKKKINELISHKHKTYKDYIYFFNDIIEDCYKLIFDNKCCKFKIDVNETSIIFPLPPTIYNKIYNTLTKKEAELNLIVNNINSYNKSEHNFKSQYMLKKYNNADSKETYNKTLISNQVNNSVYLKSNQQDDTYLGMILLEENFKNDKTRDYIVYLSNKIYSNTLFDNEQYIEVCKNIMYITIVDIHHNIIKNLFSDEKYSKSNLKLTLEKIFNVLNYSKSIKVSSFQLELVNQFLLNLMINTSNQVLTTHKKAIMDYYFTKEFFMMSDKCLKQWRIIIQKFAASSPEIIDDFLVK